jgi:integrase
MPGAVAAAPKKRWEPWNDSVGDHRFKIRLYRDIISGILYCETKDPSRPGHYIARSLRHKDKKKALEWANSEVARYLMSDVAEGIPRASHIFALYLQHATPRKSKSEQDADERRGKMWRKYLGSDKDLSKLTLREWQSFTDARTRGEIDAKGDPVPPDKRVAVRAATAGADLTFLITVVNWATKWRERDQYLMRENPARGYPIPSERNPRRPVVTHDRFLAVRRKADQVMTVRGRGEDRQIVRSYLPDILDLVEASGRRISAVLALRYCDLKLGEGPNGSILWPAATDKMKKQWLVPMSPDVRAAIDRILRERPGIGAGFLFPAINDPSKPIAVEVASAWLLKAEQLAGVEKHEGSLWHAYRRKWATERKGLSVADVAAAGGWTDHTVLTGVYQQPDPATLLQVVSAPARLRELK